MVNLVVQPFSTVKQIILDSKRIVVFRDEHRPYYFWTNDNTLTQEEKQQLEPYIIPLLALYGVRYDKDRASS